MKVNLSITAIALVILCAASSGCVDFNDDHEDSPQVAQLTAAIGGSCTLTVFTETSPQDKVIVTVDGFASYSCYGFCQDTLNYGAQVSLKVPFPTDRVNCISFMEWTGTTCASGTPGNVCRTVCLADTKVTANWSPIIGCDPQ